MVFISSSSGVRIVLTYGVDVCFCVWMRHASLDDAWSEHNVHIQVRTHTSVCVRSCMCTFCVRMCTHVHVCARMCTYVYVCVRMCMYVYVCVCMCTYVYVCVRVCTYVNTHCDCMYTLMEHISRHDVWCKKVCIWCSYRFSGGFIVLSCGFHLGVDVCE